MSARGKTASFCRTKTNVAAIEEDIEAMDCWKKLTAWAVAHSVPRCGVL